MTSLVNEKLKFQMLIPQICQYFLLKECEKLLQCKSRKEKTDSIKFKISPKTPHGKKNSTKRHHHRHHKRHAGEQQFPIQVDTGYSNI